MYLFCLERSVDAPCPPVVERLWFYNGVLGQVWCKTTVFLWRNKHILNTVKSQFE